MDGPVDFRAVAAQLANPEGEAGVKTAEHMNISNADMTRHTVDLLNCTDYDRILEIGPGNGRFAAYVLSKGVGLHYTGADISATMIATAEAINKQHIDAGQAVFKLVDGTMLPFPDHLFDRVFTVNTLYFWKDPVKQLAEIKRILKPTGTFCLSIGSKAFMQRLPFTTFGFTLYSPEEAENLLRANGFERLEKTLREQKISVSSNEEIIRDEVFLRTM